MIEADDLLLQSFIEDSVEHLQNIESDLMDMEAGGAKPDPELVNSIFRAAHSIKGGAGMLGLEKMKTLAHRLENVLHMVRSGDLAPNPAMVSTLLKGFDQLHRMAVAAGESEGADISAQVQALDLILSGGAKAEGQPVAAAPEPGCCVERDGRTLFDIDPVSLRYARCGGKNLFLLEYDLIHDVQRKNRTPLQVIQELEKSGEIVDCKVDVEAAGTLDGPLTRSIPLFVVFATILEADLLAGFCRLDPARIKPLDASSKEGPACLPLWEEARGGFLLLGMGDQATLRFPAAVGRDMLEDLRQTLLAGLDRAASISLDLGRLEEVDELFFPLCCIAHQSAGKRGKTLRLSAGAPRLVADTARSLGFPCTLSRAGEAGCLFA